MKVYETSLCVGGVLNGMKRPDQGGKSFQIAKKMEMQQIDRLSGAEVSIGMDIEHETYTKRTWNDYKKDKSYTLWGLEGLTDDQCFKTFLSFALDEMTKDKNPDYVK